MENFVHCIKSFLHGEKFMRKQLLILCLGVWALAPLYGAKEERHKKSSSSSSSCSSIFLPNTNADDAADPILLDFTYQKIPFAQITNIFGKGITVVSDTDFRLDTGRYLVTYSNTEAGTSGSDPTLNIAFLDFAVYLGGIPVITYTDTVENDADGIALKSFSLIVNAVRPSLLNIQARLDPISPETGPSVTLDQRTLTITRLSDSVADLF
jgi:hypothetical protein